MRVLRKLYYRLFVCGSDRHVAPSMKLGEYGGPAYDHCLNCGANLTPKKWRR